MTDDRAHPEAGAGGSAARLRVVVAASCHADAEAALALAAALARMTGAELQGVLVRDQAVLDAATHPGARLLGYGGRPVPRMSVAAMLRAFEADARRFERDLARLSQPAPADAVRILTGRLPDAMRTAAAAGDFAVLGFRHLRYHGRQDAARAGADLVLALGAGIDPPAFAADLARALGRHLIVLAAAGEEARVAAWFDARPGPRPDIRAYRGAQGLIAALDRLGPEGVVLATEERDPRVLDRLVEAARCPVILRVPAPG